MVIVKDKLKDDIRFMLTSLVSQLKNTDEDYNTLIADIYNDLDNLSMIDLYVMREYVKDSVNHLKAEKQANKIPKKGMLAAKMKVISDDVGNFYVVVEKNGEERIVLQTTDKNKADQYVRDNQSNVAMAAAPEDEIEDDVNEDLTSIPEDDLPNTRVNKPDDEDDEDESDIEELDEFDSDEVDAEVLEEINELIDRADHLVSVIDNSIDVVPDLDAITELVNIKVTIQDKMDELNSMDPSSPDLDEAMEALRNELEEYESKALDIIDKNTPWTEKESEGEEDVEEFDEDEEDESVEESIVVEEEKEFIDDENLNDDEFDDKEEDIEEFDEDENEEVDEEFDEESDVELDEEDLETNDIDELIDDLLSTLEDVEEKVEDIKETVESKAKIDTSNEELDEDEDLDEEESDDVEEEDISLESSILSPSGNSLEKGEKEDPELESDTPVTKMIPEDNGVAEIGRDKLDKKPCEELPLEGPYPLKASKNSMAKR